MKSQGVVQGAARAAAASVKGQAGVGSMTWVIIGIIVVAVVGGGGYAYYSSTLHAPIQVPVVNGTSTVAQGTTTINNPYNYSSNLESYYTSPNIAVSNASVSFAPVAVTDVSQVLYYVLSGPTLTITSSKQGSGYVTVTIYDSSGDTLYNKKGPVALVQGKQVVNLSSSEYPGLPSGTGVIEPGQYTVSMVFYKSENYTTGNFSTPIYSQNFTAIAGATGAPVVQAASVKVQNATFYLNQPDSSFELNYTAVVTNVGNADLMGYLNYTVIVSGNGTNQTTTGYLLADGEAWNSVPPINAADTLFYSQAGKQNTKVLSAFTQYPVWINGAGHSYPCGTYNVALNLAYIEQNPSNTNAVGASLNSTTWNGAVSLNKNNSGCQ